MDLRRFWPLDELAPDRAAGLPSALLTDSRPAIWPFWTDLPNSSKGDGGG